MAGYILVLSVLILGGVIATLGDRLGTKVGKARLSLFNLRPRDTAVVITIITGSIVSATTLGILFAVNRELRDVFQLKQLEDQRETALAELEQVQQEKTAMEAALVQAQQQQAEAQEELTLINTSLALAQSRQAATQAQLETVAGQAQELRQEAEALQAEAAELMAQRDRVQAQIEERDRAIQEQEALLAAGQAQIVEGQAQIENLESAQQFLAQAVQQLEQNYRLLQTGSVALARGQVLATAVIRSPTPEDSQTLLDQLLRQANQVAQQQIRPGTPNPEEPVIQVAQTEVDRLIEELANGQPYVVRVLSARNYVLGDSRAQVVLEVSPNRIIFAPGEVVAKASTDPVEMDLEQLRQRLDLLLAASQFRAERAGIVSEGVPLRVQTYVQFLEQLAAQTQPLMIQAVTPVPVYTVGPLRLQFIAFDADGREVFRSQDPPAVGDSRL
ncbi:MAG: DUF3084 domain-containing protein [Prochlorothrix sp.]